jgi:hypothetical protein
MSGLGDHLFVGPLVLSSVAAHEIERREVQGGHRTNLATHLEKTGGHDAIERSIRFTTSVRDNAIDNAIARVHSSHSPHSHPVSLAATGERIPRAGPAPVGSRPVAGLHPGSCRGGLRWGRRCFVVGLADRGHHERYDNPGEGDDFDHFNSRRADTNRGCIELMVGGGWAF